ncbi:hypothetical protein [Mycobacterium sp. SMC-4]|uniref:hypothetical protein n=1 Tax=Mycobacterium sp. SMC-4 TaxID=2857059 RepID=UPI0021B196F9|nr:hypothetical protein [Mycobacterium sp. SMC-4]UXA18350.1 hypothetical protein KXD98_01035 [Mycobacterium sp. SMC-4]
MFVQRAPWPVFAYLLTLIGFVFLGLFVAALAYGVGFAPALGAAMAASWLMAVGSVWLRRRQIATAAPGSHVVLSLDPIRGDTDRRAFERYLRRYRDQGAPADDAAANAARQARVDEQLAA